MKKSAICLWLLLAAQALAFVLGLSLLISGSDGVPIARFKAAHSDLDVGLKTALESFKADRGRYPNSQEGLRALSIRPADVSVTNWQGPYIEVSDVPKDPWGNEYVYRFPAAHSTNGYDLYSYGLDGITKTGGNDLDDINNWDPDSPRQSSYPDPDTIGALLLLLAPICWGMRLISGFLSRRVRVFMSENRVADRVWRMIALIALLAIVFCIRPRL